MAFSVLYSIVDAKNEVSTCEVNVPAAITFANVGIFAAQMALLINPIITGAITRIGVAFTVTLPGGLRTTPVAGSDVEEGAKFQFRTAGNFFTGLRLPTFDETLIQSNSRAIDLEDADVAAFIDAMTDGIDLTGAGGTGTPQPCDKREADIVALSFAREQFLSSRG